MTTTFNPTSFGTSLSADIHQLHNGLAAIGFTIPTDEIRNGIAGTGTRKAVASFQKERGLEASGIVDLVTSNALRAAIDQNSYIVEGRVASPDRAAVSGLTV